MRQVSLVVAAVLSAFLIKFHCRPPARSYGQLRLTTAVHALQSPAIHADEVLGILVHVHCSVLLNSVSSKQNTTYTGCCTWVWEGSFLRCLRKKTPIETEKL